MWLALGRGVVLLCSGWTVLRSISRCSILWQNAAACCWTCALMEGESVWCCAGAPLGLQLTCTVLDDARVLGLVG